MTTIQFSGVSKRFTMRRTQPRSFQDKFVSLFRKRDRVFPDVFWALREVDLQIDSGETVAFIGANGAGKSTVLKLISRIIEPTSGQVLVNGRVGALLELGAGFHPDLTGRENIYLNGSILGLSRTEIRQRFDDIVSFAELERFIDVPVRHYSSGMYVRLGFAVAVHTDPQILLVDEVLAVGDQNFQHKCFERIGELQRRGITICYVSHDLSTVQRICSKAVWLEDGAVQAAGDVMDTVSCYLQHMAAREEQHLANGQESGNVAPCDQEHRWGLGPLRITNVSFLGTQGEPQAVFGVGEPCTVRMHYASPSRVERPVFGLAVHTAEGVHICGPNTTFAGLDVPYVEGEGDVYYRIGALPLLEGTYFISVAAHNKADTEMYDYHDRLYPLRVRQTGRGERFGLVTLNGEWLWDR